MIVQLFCLDSYCKNVSNDSITFPTGKLQQDSIKISIDEIREANKIFIKYKFKNNIIALKDSIIYLQNKKIDVYEDAYNKMKDAAIATERINQQLQHDVDKYKRRNVIYGGVAGGLATSLLLFLLIK